MTIVDGKTFWETMWASAEKDGESLRVGEYRSAKVNDKWGVMQDGAEYPTGQIFDAHQEAIDWMVHVECNKFSREETRHGNTGKASG